MPVCNMALDQARAPGSLDELIAASKLIVEVTVITAFPATRVGASPVTTDFVLARERVLKGQLAADRLVVNQIGGELDGRMHCAAAYPGKLMSAGQRYILFLKDPDPRSPVQPQRDGLERLATAFGFLGVVLVNQGKVEFSKDLPFRSAHEGMSAAGFMDDIATRTKD